MVVIFVMVVLGVVLPHTAKDLFLNQAALTGEALPVERKADPAATALLVVAGDHAGRAMLCGPEPSW